MPPATSTVVWAVSGALGVALAAGGAYVALADNAPPAPAQPAVTLAPAAAPSARPESGTPSGSSAAPRPEATDTREQVTPASPVSAPSPDTDD